MAGRLKNMIQSRKAGFAATEVKPTVSARQERAGAHFFGASIPPPQNSSKMGDKGARGKKGGGKGKGKGGGKGKGKGGGK